MIAAVICPACEYDTADAELIVDENNVVVKVLLTCRLCGTLFA